MKEDIKFLELLKSFTLVGRKIGFWSSGGYIDYIKEDTLITTPEGFSFTIKIVRVNLQNFVFSKTEKEEDYRMWFDFRNITTYNNNQNIENLMKPEIVSNSSYSGNSYKRFIFISKYYERQKISKPQWVMDVINEYGNSNRSYDFFPYSMVILVKTSDETQFRSFLDLKYGTLNFLTSGDGTTPVYNLYYEPYSIQECEQNTWKYYFNKSVGDALKFLNFNNLLKYDFRIFKKELTIDNRKELIVKIIDFWDDIDLDGIDNAEFIYQIMENSDDINDKIQLYDFLFENYSIRFVNLMDKLVSHENTKLKIIIFLLKCFYLKKSTISEQQINNEINSLTEDKIIPIIGTTLNGVLGFIPIPIKNPLGPKIIKEYTSSGIKITNLDIYYANENSFYSGTQKKDYHLSDGSMLDGREYPYEMILGGVCCSYGDELIKKGFIRGRIYTFPAFALFNIDEALNLDPTLGDFISGLVTSASLIFPFFRVVQGISVAENLLSIGLNLVGNAIDNGGLGAILKNTPEGKNFLYAYNFVTTFYGVKGVKEGFQKMSIYMFKDVESLMNLWSLYQNTNAYIELQNLPETTEEERKIKSQFEKLDSTMQKFQLFLVENN